jgi:hypothetical protein
MSVSEKGPGSKPCPQCGTTELFSRRVPSETVRRDLSLLAGLGGFFHTAEMDVVLCATCGLMRLFAAPEACERVRTHAEWKRVSPPAATARPSEGFAQK